MNLRTRITCWALVAIGLFAAIKIGEVPMNKPTRADTLVLAPSEICTTVPGVIGVDRQNIICDQPLRLVFSGVLAGGTPLTLAIINADGEVAINWARVEEAANNKFLHAELYGYARLMIAIRDGKWKPLP